MATTEPAQFAQIEQVAITVSDLQSSRSFYCDRLGMKFLFNSGTMTFLQCGGVRLLLGTPEPGKPIANGGTILYLKVGNLEQAHAELLAAGVASVQAPHKIARLPDHDLWLAMVSDPDGNPVGLMSETAHSE